MNLKLAHDSVFIVNMMTGMGLALGIDYSLFMISRFREERGRGRGTEAAIQITGATASRAVLLWSLQRAKPGDLRSATTHTRVRICRNEGVTCTYIYTYLYAG